MSETLTVPTLGATMPDIGLIGPDGKHSTLSQELGGSKAVVFFMRASNCPICLAHAKTILKMQAAGDLRGAKFLLVAPGDATEAATALKRLGSSKAGVWASGRNHAAVGLGTFMTIQHSGTFVLDGDGGILHVKTATIPAASFSRSAVLQALARE
ncbi:redoxin family protein (plasmid) [Glaciihabitans sp. INWT7]|uniref:redoxin family protein n=1 Tax=Glaciihabitans sp. INWT7 TaxID=2596912 RepID=UPI001629926C|nr:redoxin family protein [Glaciihabitans sp. INWT7]QNE48646.1 redoxin family protein [Glaciihabitans sp. INWT7]